MASTQKSWMVAVMVVVAASLGGGCAAEAEGDEEQPTQSEDELRSASCKDGNISVAFTWKASSSELVMDFDMSKFRANDPAQRSLYFSNGVTARLVHLTGGKEDGYMRYAFPSFNANPRLGAKTDARGHVVTRVPLTNPTWGKQSMLSPKEQPGSTLPEGTRRARPGDKLEVELDLAPSVNPATCKLTLTN